MTERLKGALLPVEELPWKAELRSTHRLYKSMARAEREENPLYLGGMSRLRRDIALLLSRSGAEILSSNPGLIKETLVKVLKSNVSLEERPHETSRSRGISLAEARVLIQAYGLTGKALTEREIANLEELGKTADVGRIVRRTRREIAEAISPRGLWKR